MKERVIIVKVPASFLKMLPYSPEYVEVWNCRIVYYAGIRQAFELELHKSKQSDEETHERIIG